MQFDAVRIRLGEPVNAKFASIEELRPSATRVAQRFAESTDDPHQLLFSTGVDGHYIYAGCSYQGISAGNVTAYPLFKGVNKPRMPIKGVDPTLLQLAEGLLDDAGIDEPNAQIAAALANFSAVQKAVSGRHLDIYEVHSAWVAKKWRGTRAGQHLYLHLLQKLAQRNAVLVPGMWPDDGTKSSGAFSGTSTSARRVWATLGRYVLVKGLVAWGGSGALKFPPLETRPRGFAKDRDRPRQNTWREETP